MSRRYVLVKDGVVVRVIRRPAPGFVAPDGAALIEVDREDVRVGWAGDASGWRPPVVSRPPSPRQSAATTLLAGAVAACLVLAVAVWLAQAYAPGGNPIDDTGVPPWTTSPSQASP